LRLDWVVLKIIGITESTYYYHHQSNKPKASNDENGRKTSGRPIPGYSLNQHGKPISDEQIKEWLFELIASEESIYGYRKLTKCLVYQYKLNINKKKVYRLCKQLGILKKQRQLLAKYPRRLARNRTITGVNQL
jgi:putative transposase